MCRKQLPVITQPRCMKCGKPVKDEEQEYCYDCRRHAYAYDQGRSLWRHVPPVTQAIYQFKFHNRRYYAEIFAEEMARQYELWIRNRKIEEILPVPLHASKRRSRGYNQAELLADCLGKKLEIPVNKRAVFRIRNTRPQKLLDGGERIQNLQGAFGVSKSWKAAGSVLLIDDIYTTGSTIDAAASVLLESGAEKVYFLSISIGRGY